MSIPLSKIRQIGDTYYLSGELGFVKDDQPVEGITAQTTLTLERIAATLATVGLTPDDVVSAACYLTDPADFAAFNAAYAPFFPGEKPTRTTIVCTLVVASALVEITVIAQKKAA
ncbi:RidA family protein [Ketogulonicigenium vulgare]|uniref:RidA family protein n=1 Tax=Ketogulonicigenium vulgare TaxID=92945 RepID=UPI0023592EE2|nr:RidA family protein [Ketogulonicigenium vulgare]